jgi:Complex I intermediate-associated protein 30 (CIA30)
LNFPDIKLTNQKSHLTCSESTARFHGHLDIKTLGGAGFASQRTTGEDRKWDLADYEGIELLITNGDAKQYTFILKDELLPADPATGRDQSTISYEYDFQIAMEKVKDRTASVCIAWSDLKATYRGKEKRDAPPLDLGNIKRMSLMMRR